MAMQTIPRSAEMEFFAGTPDAFRETVTHPVSTFYAQCPGMVMPYMDSGIHIGADNSIILEGDVVMNRTTLEIGEIDYFHGSHPLRFTLDGEMVERTVRMPVAQMCSHEMRSPRPPLMASTISLRTDAKESKNDAYCSSYVR